jgi:SagB-type dehydrogenase family enzyme
MLRPKKNMGLYFHQLSKDLTQNGQIIFPKKNEETPESWKTFEYKAYPHSKKVQLLNPKDLNIKFKNLNEVILERKSTGSSEQSINVVTIKNLSCLCAYSFGLNYARSNEANEYRVYPSGGARYSLEFYVLINRSNEIEPGLYHYNLREHSLEFISETDKNVISEITFNDWTEKSSFVIFVTTVFDRTTRKYGERGYRYILLEAGHVGQNLYLNSTNLGINICAVGGTFDDKIEKLLKIDGESESLVISYFLG